MGRNLLTHYQLQKEAEVDRVLSGRDHLWRFQSGDEWKKLPDCFKAPNRGRRLKARRIVQIECWQCGQETNRHRQSARYCSDECRRRAQLERDALRKGKALPTERVRGAERRQRARAKGIKRYGSLAEYLRVKAETAQRRDAERIERRWKENVSHDSSQSAVEEWVAYHRSGLGFKDKSHVIRYVRTFQP